MTERLAAVRATPHDGRLQSLGNLLDIADRELVKLWGRPGHDGRRAEYRRLLGEMREANGWVWAETRRQQATIRPPQRRQTPKGRASKALPASSGVERPDGGVRASKPVNPVSAPASAR